MITTIIIFILVLGVLVFVHELGHFIVARRAGMAAEEFGFGFPPRIFGLQRIDGKWKIVGSGQADPNHTVYSLNLIPFGAFVRIRGEDGNADDPKSFGKANWWKRLATLAAGVVMNVIAAWVLFTIGLTFGLPASIPEQTPKFASFSDTRTVITDVSKDSPASKANIQAGDTIIAINQEPITNDNQVRKIIGSSPDKEVSLTIKRNQETLNLTATPQKAPNEDRGVIGIQLSQVGTLKYSWFYAPIAAAQVTFIQLGAIISGLYQLITAGVGLGDIAGPAKIAQITGQAARLGWPYLLQFAAFLSLNLAVLNALPFPALDGGRIFFLVMEKIRGKKLNSNIEQWTNAIGFLVLLLLVAVVTINDIRSFEFVKKLF